MNKTELERVDQLVELYLSKANKDQHISEAALQGKTVSQMLIEHGAGLPRGTSFTHELVSAVVDRLRCLYITHDERYAEQLIGLLPLNDQYHVLAMSFYKRRVNEAGEKYTRALIAIEIFEITENEYKYSLQRIRATLIELDYKSTAKVG